MSAATPSALAGDVFNKFVYPSGFLATYTDTNDQYYWYYQMMTWYSVLLYDGDIVLLKAQPADNYRKLKPNSVKSV